MIRSDTTDEDLNSHTPSKHLVVSLQRLNEIELENTSSKFQMVLNIDKVVQCPGCSLFLGNDEKMAQHLLQECLLPRYEIDGDDFRSKLTQWILRYFYVHFMKNSSNETQESVINDTTNHSYKGKLWQCKIQLRHLSFDVQCPVCEKYFWPPGICYRHLFEDCLRTKNLQNALLVSDWFSQYLWSNGESKLEFISRGTNVQDFGKRVICKYCKKEFLDKDSVMKHYRASHRREHESGDSTCNFCNFKPGSPGLLFRHLMEKHVKCGCGERFKIFALLKMHLSTCLKRSKCLCPTCQEVEVGSFAEEANFENHILNCRRPIPLNFSLQNLYKECNICWQQIMTCNLDIHIARHVKFTDSEKRKVRNAFINLEDLKDELSDQDFFKMKTLLG